MVNPEILNSEITSYKFSFYLTSHAYTNSFCPYNIILKNYHKISLTQRELKVVFHTIRFILGFALLEG